MKALKVLWWRGVMVLVATAQFCWAVVAVPVERATLRLVAWADAAEIAWLLAVCEAALAAKREKLASEAEPDVVPEQLGGSFWWDT